MGKSAQAFRTISEAAAELKLPQHVLRFWETRFTQIKPLKRGGGRRYYRPEDILLLKGIQHLLYDKGFTIKGVQRILKSEGSRHVMAIGESSNVSLLDEKSGGESAPATGNTNSPHRRLASTSSREANGASTISASGRKKLSKIMSELLDCKRMLDNARDI